MPFDVLPQETQTEIGQFQKYAEAMLRGCAVTKQIKQLYTTADGRGACAIGAMWIGMGIANAAQRVEAERLVDEAYTARYGQPVFKDNDAGMSREEIAARIAAL